MPRWKGIQNWEGKEEQNAAIVLRYHLQRRFSTRCLRLNNWKKDWMISYRFFFSFRNTFVTCGRHWDGNAFLSPESSETKFIFIVPLKQRDWHCLTVTDGESEDWRWSGWVKSASCIDFLLLGSITDKCTFGNGLENTECKGSASPQQENGIPAFQARDVETQSCCS